MPGPERRLVIVDRDGVINEDSSEYIKTPDEWRPVPGALEAIAALTAAGIDVVVVTNQSGLARGLFTEEALDAIHAKMRSAVESAGGRIDAIYHCPHAPWEGCDCRKPKPGLLRRVALDFGIDLADVRFIGDKRSDVEAAVNAGAVPVLVGDAPGGSWADGVARYRDLAAAVSALFGAESGTA